MMHQALGECILFISQSSLYCTAFSFETKSYQALIIKAYEYNFLRQIIGRYRVTIYVSSHQLYFKKKISLEYELHILTLYEL